MEQPPLKKEKIEEEKAFVGSQQTEKSTVLSHRKAMRGSADPTHVQDKDFIILQTPKRLFFHQITSKKSPTSKIKLPGKVKVEGSRFIGQKWDSFYEVVDKDFRLCETIPEFWHNQDLAEEIEEEESRQGKQAPPFEGLTANSNVITEELIKSNASQNPDDELVRLEQKENIDQNENKEQNEQSEMEQSEMDIENQGPEQAQEISNEAKGKGRGGGRSARARGRGRGRGRPETRPTPSQTESTMDMKTITKLRQQYDTNQVIEIISQSNPNYDNKSIFCKAKYINKKKQAHSKLFRLLKPSVSLLLQYFRRDKPSAVCFLREDTMALLLHKANIQAGARVIVHDACQGLIVAAVAERLGGYGEVVNVTQHNETTMIRAMAFPQTIMDTIFTCQLQNFIKIFNNKMCGNDEISSVAALQTNAPRDGPPPEGAVPRVLHIARLLHREASSLIIVATHDILSTFVPLYLMLQSGAPFVVFSRQVSPLALLKRVLDGKSAGSGEEEALWNRLTGKMALRAAGVELVECFWREWQVLDRRTHPKMNMDQASGYLLSGYKLDD